MNTQILERPAIQSKMKKTVRTIEVIWEEETRIAVVSGHGPTVPADDERSRVPDEAAPGLAAPAEIDIEEDGTS